MTKTHQRKRYNRTWSPEQKLRILQEAQLIKAKRSLGQDTPESVADLCRRYGITTAWLAEWKKEMRRKGLWEIKDA